MYSRNISFPESITSVRGIQNDIRKSPAVPVKSYVNKSAYEHFGKMGSDETVSKPAEEILTVVTPLEDTVSYNDSSQEIQVRAPEASKNSDAVVSAINNKSDTTTQTSFSLKSLIPKLTDLIDCDIILPIFAIALFFLSDKESNNLITSLALIAIMLL